MDVGIKIEDVECAVCGQSLERNEEFGIIANRIEVLFFCSKHLGPVADMQAALKRLIEDAEEKKVKRLGLKIVNYSKQ